MAKITTARRKRLPASKFGLPEERKYPIDTKARAQNAKARAAQQHAKGNLSTAKLNKVNRRANAVLKAKRAKTITSPTGKTIKVRKR
jgi:hypothetical protein